MLSHHVCHLRFGNRKRSELAHTCLVQICPPGKGEKVQLDGKALASMNMWGFTPDYFEKSEAIFKDFIVRNANELKAEFYIPYAIDCMIKDNSARTELLSTPSRWFGVTFKEDRPGVVAKFQEFADKGIYPSPLY